MTKEEVIAFFKEKPYSLEMGVGKLSSWLKTDVDTIRIARAIVRKNMKEFGTTYHPKEVAFKAVEKYPRILFIDIETSPLLAMVYQKQVWKARVGYNAVISDWYMLTYAYKWAGDINVYSERITGDEAKREDDSRIVSKLWDVMNEADIVIAHNGDSFDIPNINSRFILNDLIPPSSYRQIDTLKICQKQFGFTHNSLNALAIKFGIPLKIETDLSLWKRCIFGEDKALEEMEFYNRHDVEMLEDLYLKLRPWIKSHVNLSVYNDNPEHQCPHCGGDKLIQDGYSYTNTAKYENYRCISCGAISRGRKTVISKHKKMLVSLPGR